MCPDPRPAGVFWTPLLQDELFAPSCRYVLYKAFLRSMNVFLVLYKYIQCHKITIYTRWTTCACVCEEQACMSKWPLCCLALWKSARKISSKCSRQSLLVPPPSPLHLQHTLALTLSLTISGSLSHALLLSLSLVLSLSLSLSCSLSLFSLALSLTAFSLACTAL